MANAYLFIVAGFALAGGVVGRIKGGSFWLWFTISGVLPFIGLFAAIAHRDERNEPRRRCPRCGSVRKLQDTLCTRCGCELYFPERLLDAESQAIDGGARAAR